MAETKAGDIVIMTKPRFDGNCFECRRKGHKSVECRAKTSEKWCSNCRHKTPKTKNCWKKDTAEKATGEAMPNDDEHTFAIVFKDTNEKSGIDNSNSSLLVDTGATSHIINDKSKFLDFDQEFNPSAHVIELANGSKANVVLGKENAKVKL